MTNEQPRYEEKPRPGDESENGEASLVQAVPGLFRIAATAWWRAAEWTVTGSVRASSRLMQAALNGEAPGELFQQTGEDLRAYLRRLLEMVDPGATPAGEEPAGDNSDGVDVGAKTTTLRERGAELLRESADVHFDEHVHPAYDRILGELSPDEGRVVRLLALEGPQPAVDVRTSRLFSVGSELLAPGLTMIGEEAGCRHLDRVPAYLNNLERLGLVWFSREQVGDHLEYQVLENQPAVQTAMSSGRTRTVRRSIHLTPFGEDFSETCLPLHTAELAALPGAGEPPPETTGEL
jgi:hypothetical protein